MRVGTWCPIHDCEFALCICPERRDTTAEARQLIVCEGCRQHFTRCVCASPQLVPTVAA